MSMIKGIREKYRPKKIGSVRLGIKVPDIDKATGQQKMRQGEPATRPMATPWFVVDNGVREIYGEQPTVLPIFFLENTIERVLPTALAVFAGNGSVRCMGDGERVTYRSHYDPQTKQSETLIHSRVARWDRIRETGLDRTWSQDDTYGAMEEAGNTVRCLFRECPQFCSWGCRHTGWFRFSIKGIIRQGYWQMVIHFNPMEQLLSQLEQAMDIIEQHCGRRTLMHAEYILELTGPEKKWIKTRQGNRLMDVYTPELELDPAWLTRAVEGRVRLPLEERITAADIYGPQEEPEMDSELLEDLPYDPTPEGEDDNLPF